MKYIKQITIIFGFSFLGELLNYLLPFPIPAAIYGLFLLFLSLSIGAIRPTSVRETSIFLSSLLPLLFVAPLVNIVDYYSLLIDNIRPLLIIIVLGLFLTFGASGSVTQFFIKRLEKEDDNE